MWEMLEPNSGLRWFSLVGVGDARTKPEKVVQFGWCDV